MSILNNSLLLGADAGATGYQISRSLRFNSSDSAYLSRTPASAGNRKTWTWAGWVKLSATSFNNLLECVGPTTPGTRTSFMVNDLNKLDFFTDNTSSSRLTTTQVFRDFSAWYHIVLAVDTTQATASNRVKVYVNGSQVTAFDTANYPSQNLDTQVNNTQLHTIGRVYDPFYANMYLADVHLIDGQALTPSSFTEVSATTGQLVPKQYTGSFGTNGFWLKFSDNSAATATTLGKDYSGNNNNWTPNNLSVTAGAGNDSLVDTPTSYGTGNSGGDVRGNYATLNPLNLGASATLANGNLDHASTTGFWTTALSTIGMQSGKWYFEATMTSTGEQMVGIANSAFTTSTYLGANTNSWSYYSSGVKYTNASASSYGASYTNGDVIGVTLDIDAGTVTFYKNGATQGQAFSGLTGPLFFGVSGISSTTRVVNFGQRPFAYTAPSGYKALCDTNLPAPVVANSSTVMDVKLYTGNGYPASGTQNISGLNFSPDFVWIKARNQPVTTGHHTLTDVVRGTNKQLFSHVTAAEESVTDAITAFNSDGFSLGVNATGTYPNVNCDTTSYTAWCWDAGSSTVTNTQGSITSQVRANVSSGFSVVTYTGNLSSAGTSTVGHGLGIAPSLVITKRRDGASNWRVQHISTSTASRTLFLDATDAEFDLSGNGTLSRPTSSVFSVNWSTGLGVNGQTHVAYCFAPVAGYSAMGVYDGNGSASDGPFVFCGFRPRFLLLKATNLGSDWFIFDAARNTSNVVFNRLRPSSSGAEDSNLNTVDFLSNGFKFRDNNIAWNGSGYSYIYFAVAESPFAYSRAR